MVRRMRRLVAVSVALVAAASCGSDMSQHELETPPTGGGETESTIGEAAPGSAGGEPQTDPSPAALLVDPVTLEMTVTASDGSVHVARGTTCTFDVSRRELDRGLACQAHVTCAGVRLYGELDTTGFFDCTLTPTSVVGGDPRTSGDDDDAAIAIDTRAATITIHDDDDGRLGAFHVTGTLAIVPQANR